MYKENNRIYEQILEALAHFLQKEGFTKIKANLQGYDKPNRVSWEQTERGVLPDLVAFNNDNTYVFEVEDSAETPKQEQIARWKLLSSFAKMHGGKLYMVVPDSIENDIKKILPNHGLQLDILTVAGYSN